jgi:tetratricopeptide (TPR) repeat protein
VELNSADSVQLPSKLSARTTSIAAFVIGLIYLKDAGNTEDYKLALHEFSVAIRNTAPELANLPDGSNQQYAVKRTLAIFYVLRGRVSAALNDNQKAFQDYSQAESLDPYYPSIYVAKGNYYYGLREFDQAKQQYEKAISPWKSAAAYYGLGNALFYLNRHPESKEAYRKAINLMESKGEDASVVRIVLGVVYNLTAETRLALEQWDQVVQSTSASQVHQQQAQTLIASIRNPTPSPTLPSSAPTLAGTDTATPTPTGSLVMTLVINPDTSTRKPTSTTSSFPGFGDLILLHQHQLALPYHQTPHCFPRPLCFPRPFP